MFKKTGTLVTKGTSELKKSKSLEIIQEITPKVLRTSYHGSSNLNANCTALWDKITIGKQEIEYKTAVEENNNFFNERIIRSKEIKKEINYALIKDTKVKEWDSYLRSHNTFRKALEHDCFYDIISKNENDDGTLTIAFLPFSTSQNEVLCGLQRFDKIHLLSNYNKNFYITRILFHKIMTKAEFEKWETESKRWYQDLKLRKIIFDEVQKDLDANKYSLLKDTDLVKSNLGFFSKELPLVKFKFTDLEF